MSKNIYQESPPVCARSGCTNPAKIRYDNKWAKHCSKSCQSSDSSRKGLAKRKQTCLEKYGVENPMQCQVVRRKSEDTCIIRYGTRSPLESESVRTKIKESLVNSYGVDNPMKSKDIREKQKQTVVSLYGVENVSTSCVIKEKKKNTWLEKYGVDNPSRAKRVREKRRLTQERNGTIVPVDMISEQQKYYRKVDSLTEEAYRLHYEKINPNNYDRGRFAYHLDHKLSRHEGFMNNIPPEIIGHWTNLEMIHWVDNLTKNRKSSITYTELLESYNQAITA